MWQCGWHGGVCIFGVNDLGRVFSMEDGLCG